MCQANLAIRDFGKIAIGKGGRGEIREQPVIDVGARRLNRVERQSAMIGYLHQSETILDCQEIQPYSE